MTATSHHGFHPDAESLSAFSERALEGRERAEVLAHLAVCGRCREVVALASEAAAAGKVTAAAAPRKVIVPNAWWKQWRLVWVPTAVVVAFAVASISAYIDLASSRYSGFKIVIQRPTPGATPPPAPTEQAKVEPPAAEPPAAAAPATPPARPAKRAHSGVEERAPAAAPPVVASQRPVVAAQMPSEPGAPEPGPMNQAEAYRETPRPSHAEATPAPPELTAGATRPADSQPRSAEEEKKQAEPQRQAEVDRSQMRNFKARVAPFAGHGTDAAPPAGTTQTVTVTAAPQPETQPAATAEPASIFGIKSSRDVTTPTNPIQLPSGLMAVSIASGWHFLLAIDEHGVLFLSEDRGVTWEHVTKQWMGRAIAVRRRARDHGVPQAAPPAQNGMTGDGTTSGGAGGGSSADTGDAPSLVEFFELTNDKNETWVSTDGRTWTPK